jgi:hypothetical protein
MTRRYINRMDERLQVSVDKLNGKFSVKRRSIEAHPFVSGIAWDAPL